MALTPFPNNFNPVSFLANLRYRVSPTIYRAFDFIFNPCCVFQISDLDFTCVSVTGDNTVIDVTITLDKEMNLRGNGTYQVIFTAAGRQYAFTGSFTDGDTITLEDITLPNNISPTVRVTLFIPTNSDGTIGVYSQSDAFASPSIGCLS